MTEENIRLFLLALGVSNGELHGDWYRASCPLAFHRHKGGKDSNPSFGIYHNPTGRSGYSCFGCNLHSKDVGDLLPEVMYALKHPEYPPPLINLAMATQIVVADGESGYHSSEWTGQVVKVEQKFEEWPLWWLSSFYPVQQFPEAMAYLHSRGIPVPLWGKMDLRFDSQRKTVCFPFYNASGKLAGMRGRYLHPKGAFRHHDYKWNGVSNTRLVFLGEHHVSFLLPLVVVEGEFDYAKVYQVYPNVVANFTASLSEPKVKKLKGAIEVIGFFDDDEAGVIASEMLREKLGADYRSVVYPSGAFKEKRDPGNLSLPEIRSMLKPFVPVDKLI